VVRESINKLPPREKNILEARFYKNMKMREIGEIYNISPSRISRILQSGLSKVKRDLQKRGYVY
ncbi:MAG: sigma-70 family RNA polymerase sigma factor, partial [Cyanobacteria bacterium HKST-UBA05]|nr:sigma-70 family RNA polymerase sigma factor [Cyanobacteria bacterium HKST-UBA05]